MLGHLLSAWCLQPIATPNQATAAAAVAATSSAATAFVDPAFTIAVSVIAIVRVPATASATASATSLLLPHCCCCLCRCFFCRFQAAGKRHIAFALSLACLLASTKQLLLCLCHGCWQYKSFCITANASASGGHGTTYSHRADLLSLPWLQEKSATIGLPCCSVATSTVE